MRDHTRLKVFNLADKLALAIYRDTSSFPPNEQSGLQSQMRRAAVSVATNIVEGSAQSTQKEYARFIEMAYASVRELEYQISLSVRLRLLRPDLRPTPEPLCTEVCKALGGLLRSLRNS